MFLQKTKTSSALVSLPSCVIDKIRQTYPDADAEGFHYPPLEELYTK